MEEAEDAPDRRRWGLITVAAKVVHDRPVLLVLATAAAVETTIACPSPNLLIGPGCLHLPVPVLAAMPHMQVPCTQV